MHFKAQVIKLDTGCHEVVWDLSPLPFSLNVDAEGGVLSKEILVSYIKQGVLEIVNFGDIYVDLSTVVQCVYIFCKLVTLLFLGNIQLLVKTLFE